MIDGDDMDAVLAWLGIEPAEIGVLGDALDGILSTTGQIAQHLGLDQRSIVFVLVTAVGSAVAGQREQADFDQMLYFLRQTIEKAPKLRQEALARLPKRGRREQVH